MEEKLKRRDILGILFLVATLFIVTCLSSGDLKLYFILSIALVIFSIVMKFRNRITIYRKGASFNIWYFVFWTLVFINGLFFTPGYFGWRTILVYMTPFFAVMWFYGEETDGCKLFDILNKSIVISDVVLLVYLLLHELPSIISGNMRIGSSASGNVNTVAVMLCIFLAFVLYNILFENKTRLIWLLIPTIVFILLTGSKKGILGIVSIVLLMSFLKYGLRIYKYIIPVGLVCLVLYIAMNNQYFYSIIGHRIDVFFNAIETNSGLGSTGMRQRMIEIGMEYFKQKPIFGNGSGYYAKYSGFETYSHNNYLEMLVSFGLFGTILYYSFFAKTIIRCLKTIRTQRESVLFLSVIITQLIFDYACVSYYSNIIIYISLFFFDKILYYYENAD